MTSSDDAAEAWSPATDGVEGSEEQSSADNPKGSSGQDPPTDTSGWQSWYRRLQPLLGYLPTGVHEDDTERDGLLSYSVEVHAAIIGLAVGAAAATAGDIQLVMGLVTVGLGVGRAQQQFSDKVQSQILKEPWYAISGAAVGYLAVYIGLMGQLPHFPV